MEPHGKIVALDIATGKATSTFPIPESEGPREMVYNFCLSPDGSKLAVDTPSVQGVEIHDSRTGDLQYSLPDEPGTIYWLAWSPDSQRLAIARDNGNIAVWNLDTVGQTLTKLGLNP